MEEMDVYYLEEMFDEACRIADSYPRDDEQKQAQRWVDQMNGGSNERR